MKSPEAYIDALECSVKLARSNIAVVAVPLALVLSQMRTVYVIEGFFISLFASISILSFSVGLALTFYNLMLLQIFEMKEKLLRDGATDGKGFHYLRYMEGLFGEGPVDLTEEGLLLVAKWMLKPVSVSIISGYSSLLLFILTLLWSAPSV